jgi:hypothetical protein
MRKLSKATSSSSSEVPMEKQRKSIGRVPGSKNFSKEEIAELLIVVDAIKPAGKDMWGKVEVALHCKGLSRNMSWPERDGETCKKKFGSLIPKQKPTGSTEIPILTAEVMRINTSIEESWYAGALDEVCANSSHCENDDTSRVQSSEIETESFPSSSPVSSPIVPIRRSKRKRIDEFQASMMSAIRVMTESQERSKVALQSIMESQAKRDEIMFKFLERFMKDDTK